MERDGFSREEAIKRISSQMPLSEKVSYADFVIDNGGSIEDTERQVREVFKLLKKQLQEQARTLPPAPS